MDKRVGMALPGSGLENRGGGGVKILCNNCRTVVYTTKPGEQVVNVGLNGRIGTRAVFGACVCGTRYAVDVTDP